MRKPVSFIFVAACILSVSSVFGAEQATPAQVTTTSADGRSTTVSTTTTTATASVAGEPATVAAAPLAQPTPEQLMNFGSGPAQWLMTGEERAAWRRVTTPEQAQAFVDLFWARRDPTVGTPVNEFRDQYDARIAYADAHYRTKKTRGALTDMGRVMILLGQPAEDNEIVAGKEATFLEGGRSNSAMGGRKLFVYSRQQQPLLTGPVNFVQNSEGDYKIDVQKSAIGGAMLEAVRSAVKNPGLNVVPDWAHPVAAAAPVATTQNVVTTTTTTIRTVQPDPGAITVTQQPGVRKLFLSKDVARLNPQGSDLFSTAASATGFTPNDDLGYAAQYCVASFNPSTSAPPELKVTLTVRGTIEGKNLRMVAPPEETTPDGLKANPGCYLIRGSLPLSDFKPGDYQLTVKITDADGGNPYEVSEPFKVQ
jgi:GWxTD domain-containing protein